MTILVGGGSVLAVAVPAAAAPPSPPSPVSLQGELLTGSDAVFNADSCTTSAGSTQVSLTTSGTATGPYTGTFTEAVTYSFNNALPFGQVTGFHATFTITSLTGTVTGTKDLSPSGAPSSQASCLATPPGEPGDPPPFAAFFTVTPLTYQATITTPAGVHYSDSGTADATNAFAPEPITLARQAFTEHFLTSNGVTPARPQSKEDCKNGGYALYGYRNQGQCVSDVNHG